MCEHNQSNPNLPVAATRAALSVARPVMVDSISSALVRRRRVTGTGRVGNTLKDIEIDNINDYKLRENNNTESSL